MRATWTERAVSHLETELDYYGRINPALAKELSLIIKDAIANVSSMPGIGRPGKKISTRATSICLITYHGFQFVHPLNLKILLETNPFLYQFWGLSDGRAVIISTLFVSNNCSQPQNQ